MVTPPQPSGPEGGGRLRRLSRALSSLLAVVALVMLGLSMTGVSPWWAGLGSAVPATGGTGSTGRPAVPTPVPTPEPGIRYVAADGSDAASGSRQAPWATLGHAVSAAPDGATIRVGPGTFGGFVLNRSGLAITGTPGRTIVAGTDGTEDVILVEKVTSASISNLVVQGATVSFGSGIRIDSSSGVTVERNTLRDNRSFGIKLSDVTAVTVRGNDIGHNETGIEISRLGEGVVVADNEIHQNDRMVTSSRGGNGIVFHLTTGAISVTGNRIWGNRAPHLADSGYDGGAFEVYGASNLAIRGNLLWDNNNAMETGTDGVAPCADNVFERNTVRGLGTVAGETTGLILRCAERMLVAHNTFDGLDHYAFYVAQTGGYEGSIDGLRILNNVVVRGRAYSLGAGLPASLVIDHDVVLPGNTTATYGSRVAYVEGHGNTDTLAEFRAWTGHEAHGVQADPAFVDAAAGDYRLRAGSPAIDRGQDLGAGYTGRAPDAGRFEAAP